METLLALCIVYGLGPLLDLLPRHFGIQSTAKIVVYYHESYDVVTAWHARELERLNPMYGLQQDMMRLIAAREAARTSGIKPSDPEYPDIADVMNRHSI